VWGGYGTTILEVYMETTELYKMLERVDEQFASGLLTADEWTGSKLSLIVRYDGTKKCVYYIADMLSEMCVRYKKLHKAWHQVRSAVGVYEGILEKPMICLCEGGND
jgi:hypothetical protein